MSAALVLMARWMMRRIAVGEWMENPQESGCVMMVKKI